MPRWLTELQGIVTVLDGTNNPSPRRRTLKFSDHFIVTTETVDVAGVETEVIRIDLADPPP